MRLIGAVQLCCLLIFSVVAKPAQAKESRTVLVVPIHGKAGAGFDSAVVAHVEKPLKRHATVLSGAALKKALKKSHLHPQALHAAHNIAKVGKAAGATHVLIVEATGRKPHIVANTTLVDVRSGRTLMTDRYNLPKGKLTAEIGAQIVRPVSAKLGGGGGGAAAAADENPADLPTKAAAPAPAAQAPAGGASNKSGFGWPSKDQPAETGQDPTEAASGGKRASTGDEFGADDKPEPQRKADKTEKSGDDSDVEATASTAPAGNHDARWRAAARVDVGVEFLQRNGRLGAKIIPAQETLPCYCGTGSNSNPFFPGFRLSGEIFPAAFAGHGDWYEGLGIHAELFATQVKSFVGDANTTVTSSTLFGIAFGGTFRYVLWDSALAPDLNLRIGFNYFSFPLENSAFPSVSFSSPYIGLAAHIPLGMEELALIGQFDFDMTASAGGATKSALSASGTQTSGNGFLLGGGLRYTLFGKYDFSFLVRYQAYTTFYEGVANLATVTAGEQPTTIGMSDKYLQLLITFGLAF